ncbi:hypothetical protein [Paenisporosarcina sp. NPDC076898]|uniref:hypothetical protein n=1 Tax=unclassified Paenisporosarcina TaxID=2642018 RepID=UPI003D02E1F1
MEYIRSCIWGAEDTKHLAKLQWSVFGIITFILTSAIILYIADLNISFSEKNAHHVEASTHIDVSSFGAVGDGRTDDTKALQEAARQHGIISLESGKTYLISSTIELNPAIAKGIQGNNAKILLDADLPAFHLKGNKTDGGARPTENVGLEDEFSFVIDSLHVFSRDHRGTALILDGSFGVIVTKSHFYNLKKGIELINKNRNVIISENHLWNLAEYGIHYNNANVHQSILTNNHISYAEIALFFENGDVHNTQIMGNDIEVGYLKNNDTRSAIQVVCDKPKTQFSQSQIVGNSIEDHFLAKEGIINFYSKTFGPSSADSNLAPYVGMIEIMGNELSGSSKALVLENINDITINSNTFKLISEVFISIFTGGEGINMSGNIFSGREGKNYGGKILHVEGAKAGINSTLRFLNFNNNTSYNLTENPISIMRKPGLTANFKISEINISNNTFGSATKKEDATKLTGYIIDIDVPHVSGATITANIIKGSSINENGFRLVSKTNDHIIIKDNMISGLIARNGSPPTVYELPSHNGKSVIVKDNISE